MLAQSTSATGESVALEASTNSATGYAAWFTGPAGSRTYFSTRVGINQLEPLARLHVKGADQGVEVADLGADTAVIEDSRAVLGLYSSGMANSGSAVVFKAITNGEASDNWAIARSSVSTGNLLQITYGATSFHSSNSPVLTFTPARDVSVVNQLGIGTVDPRTHFHIKSSSTSTALLEGGDQQDAVLKLLEEISTPNAEYGGRITYDGTANQLLLGTSFGNLGGLTTYTNAITIPRGTGNVAIAGTMSAAVKAFRIDHPLDPANKELWHSCIESPDMMNLYNGTVVTDASGYATITLPSYFEALNRDFRYQLTVIDEDDTTDAFIWAKVVRKIGKEASNQFTIRTARGNVEVSWMVTGIRQDAYANHARITPEVEKAVKGTYLNPEAFGVIKPEEAAARATGE